MLPDDQRQSQCRMLEGRRGGFDARRLCSRRGLAATITDETIFVAGARDGVRSGLTNRRQTHDATRDGPQHRLVIQHLVMSRKRLSTKGMHERVNGRILFVCLRELLLDQFFVFRPRCAGAA